MDPGELPMQRAISRRPMPDAKAVFTCSQISFVIVRRIRYRSYHYRLFWTLRFITSGSVAAEGSLPISCLCVLRLATSDDDLRQIRSLLMRTFSRDSIFVLDLNPRFSLSLPSHRCQRTTGLSQWRVWTGSNLSHRCQIGRLL